VPLFSTARGAFWTLHSKNSQQQQQQKQHPFNGPLSGTTRASRYKKGKTNLDFTEARNSVWQWHQLGDMQACTSPSPRQHHTSPLNFLQAGYPSCHPTNSVKAQGNHSKNSQPPHVGCRSFESWH